MEIKKYNHKMSVCKVSDYSKVDLNDEFVFIGKTDDELSLVRLKENGWKMMRIQGVLDFSLIGILSKISAVLADNKIGIFAVSTFNTDYILVKEENYDKSLKALGDAGDTIV